MLLAIGKVHLGTLVTIRCFIVVTHHYKEVIRSVVTATRSGRIGIGIIDVEVFGVVAIGCVSGRVIRRHKHTTANVSITVRIVNQRFGLKSTLRITPRISARHKVRRILRTSRCGRESIPLRTLEVYLYARTAIINICAANSGKQQRKKKNSFHIIIRFFLCQIYSISSRRQKK